jgi:lipoprotein LprG
MQGMQTRSRRAVQSALAILVTAAAVLAGCSKSDEKAATPLPDAATLLKQSSETTKAEQSVHLQIAVQGTIKELPVESLTGDLTNTPAVAAQGKANIFVLGQKIDNVDFVVADGDLFAAITAGTYQNFGPAAEIYDVSVILNPDNGLANILANFTDPKADSRESIGGVETVKVTGQVSADAVNKISPGLASGGSIPGTAWIREDNHQLMQAKLEPSSGNSVTMTLSDWGKPVTVTKPAV